MSEQLSGGQSRSFALGFIGFGVLMAGAGVVLRGKHGTAVVGSTSAICYAALAAAYAKVRRLIQRVHAVSSELAEGAEQVAGAAAQLAAASQSMAKDIAHQSQSIGEVSGSSELMASIMRQSAENGAQAGTLMKAADEAAGRVTADLEALVASIHDASMAASKIAGVTRVVDELAFQTNILALNAAVEAARAGESGAGFAVVADEVRNLAQRSARAASDIAELVASSSAKTRDGEQKLDQVAGAMRSLIEQTGKVKDLMDELAVSNGELVHGTDGISGSMRQLDEAVQRVAAISEETAATGEEMSGQAASIGDLARRMLTSGAKAAKPKENLWQLK